MDGKGGGGTDGGEGERLIGREGVVLGLVAMSSLLFGGVLTMVLYHCLVFGCHIVTAIWHLVSVSRCWWFSWWWQLLLYMWASVHACFGVFVIIWVVVDRGWCWASHCVVSSLFVVVVVWSLLSSIMVVPSGGLLVGQALSTHQSMMTNDRFRSTVHHLATTFLSAVWHLACVLVKQGQRDDCAW